MVGLNKICLHIYLHIFRFEMSLHLKYDSNTFTPNQISILDKAQNFAAF